MREVAVAFDVDLATEVGVLGIKDDLGVVVVDALNVDTGDRCSCRALVLAGGEDERSIG